MAEDDTKEKPETFTKDQVAEMIDEAVKGLKGKNAEILGELKDFKAQAREAQEAAEKAAAEKAKSSGDVEALEKSWQEKFTARETELTGALAEKDSIISKLTAGAKAKDLASELALKGSERVLEQIISPRLVAEVVDGQPKVVVNDAAGQRSALTLDDFKKEILADDALKPLLAGTKGSGAGGVNPNGGAAPKTVARADFDKMSQRDRAAFFKEGGKVTDSA